MPPHTRSQKKAEKDTGDDHNEEAELLKRKRDQKAPAKDGVPKQQHKTAEVDTKHSKILGGLSDPTLNSRITGDEDNDDEHTTHYTIPFQDAKGNDKAIVCERHGNAEGLPSLIFTHGAGGGIANPATRDFASGFGTLSPVLCYQGTMNLTSRIRTFHAVIEHEKFGKVLGGRSMGARAAALTALEMEDKPEALVLVSWPLMASGKDGIKREPERREQILLDLPEGMDVLFVGGNKDVQCDLEQLAKLREQMKARSWLIEVEGADHGMSIKQKGGLKPMRMKMGELAAEWLESRNEGKRYCSIAWADEELKVVSTTWQ